MRQIIPSDSSPLWRGGIDLFDYMLRTPRGAEKNLARGDGHAQARLSGASAAAPVAAPSLFLYRSQAPETSLSTGDFAARGALPLFVGVMLADPSYEPTARYWVPERAVSARLGAKGWTRGLASPYRLAVVCRS